MLWKLQGVPKLSGDCPNKDMYVTMTLPWWEIFRNKWPAVRIPSIPCPKPQRWLNRAQIKQKWLQNSCIFLLSLLFSLFLSLYLFIPRPQKRISQGPLWECSFTCNCKLLLKPWINQCPRTIWFFLYTLKNWLNILFAYVRDFHLLTRCIFGNGCLSKVQLITKCVRTMLSLAFVLTI